VIPACDDHGVVVRTVGLMMLRRLVGMLGLGPSPDAKDVEIAVLVTSWRCCVVR
jgi:hypothetical protein